MACSYGTLLFLFRHPEGLNKWLFPPGRYSPYVWVFGNAKKVVRHRAGSMLVSARLQYCSERPRSQSLFRTQ